MGNDELLRHDADSYGDDTQPRVWNEKMVLERLQPEQEEVIT